MTASQFQPYRLLIVPGGNFEEIGNGLASDTTASIRDAVRGGLNYLGICAGAFFAGNSPYNGLNLTDGVRFNFVALEARGIRKAAVAITVAGSRRHIHAEAPESWRQGMIFATPAREDNAYSAALIKTALRGEAEGADHDRRR